MTSKFISIVGAGGKTTTMYYLADKFVNEGKKVIITTSTHIRKPVDRKVFLANDISITEFETSLIKLLEDNQSIVVANDENMKLSSPKEEFFAIMKKYADVVLAEADGAKMLPIKVPREYEPNIPKLTETVIIVVGLDCLFKKAKEVCCRYDIASKLYNWESEHFINEEDVINIMSDRRAGLKNTENLKKILILNKADNDLLKERANYIRDRLRKVLVEEVDIYITSNNKRDIYVNIVGE